MAIMKNMNREERNLNPDPSHAIKTADTSSSKSIKCIRGEIKVGNSTGLATIGDGDGDSVAFERGLNLFTANGICVRVDIIIARVCIKEQF